MLKSYILLISLLCSGCTIVGYDGPYEGRIIDSETQQPIEGAVVFGEWTKHVPSIAGAIGSDYDYKETLSDKQGQFKLRGVGLLLLSNIDPPSIGLFKAGYEQPKSSLWKDFRHKQYHPEVEIKGNQLVFKLKRMTFEERRKRYVETLGPGTLSKNRLIWMELDRENIEICRTSQGLLVLDKSYINSDEKIAQFCEELSEKENPKNEIINIPMGGTPPRKTSQPNYDEAKRGQATFTTTDGAGNAQPRP